MSRHTAGYLVVSVVVLSVVAGLPAIGYAQQDDGRFSVQWKDAPVAEVLATLQRQFGMQYVVSGELGSRSVTLALTDKTPVEALQDVLSATDLAAVNENGVWHIREVAQAAAGGRPYRPTATGGVMAQPAPYRPAPPGVNVGGAVAMPRPGGTVSGGVMGMQPGGAGFGASGLAATGTLQTYSLEDMVFRIIPLKFVDPYIVTQMFGGGIVGGQSSGGYGGSSRGGYGNDRGRSSYDRGRSSYDRGSSSYDRGGSSYDRGGSSYGGSSSGGPGVGGFY